MRLITCTLHGIDHVVALGWSNVARFPAFRRWIDVRMALGYHYAVIAAGDDRRVVYNAILGPAEVAERHVRAIAAIDVVMSGFLRAGDVSLVRVARSMRPGRLLTTPDDVLHYDTIERPPGKHPEIETAEPGSRLPDLFNGVTR